MDSFLLHSRANVAVRASAFAAIGGFSPAFPRGQDHEWIERLFDAGGHGMYVPALAITSPILIERMTKAYHRRWHYGRGRFLARMRVAEIEATTWRRIGDIPGHMWRSTYEETYRAIRQTIRHREADAFTHECAAWCRAGFIRQRLESFAAAAFAAF